MMPSWVIKPDTPSIINPIGTKPPNGKKLSLAVFVTQSSENEATNDRIMAEVAEAVWNHFVNYQ